MGIGDVELQTIDSVDPLSLQGPVLVKWDTLEDEMK